ncbi:hypothetical protein PRK78_002512 [Emydomyces testavorans]|uniref:Uncharacterized protein n=1 Tax=Emydomyces testavorans TaxID=2070801 RepID=A0AAF0DEZ6_9EURO|nr:hypothetical protein PRK78_002512 [Emydomyces testavorans]
MAKIQKNADIHAAKRMGMMKTGERRWMRMSQGMDKLQDGGQQGESGRASGMRIGGMDGVLDVVGTEKVFGDLKNAVGGHNRNGAAKMRNKTTKKVYMAATIENGGTTKEIRS